MSQNEKQFSGRCAESAGSAPAGADPEAPERARMEAFYRARLPYVAVGWGRDKAGAYHAQFARDAWAAWQEARRQANRLVDIQTGE